MEKNIKTAVVIIAALGLLLGLSLGQNYYQHKQIQKLKYVKCNKRLNQSSYHSCNDCGMQNEAQRLRNEVLRLQRKNQRLSPEIELLKLELQELKSHKAELLFEISDLKMEY